jgi:hypothetical protein
VLLESWVLVFNPSPTSSSLSASVASSSSEGYYHGESDRTSTLTSSSTTTGTGAGGGSCTLDDIQTWHHVLQKLLQPLEDLSSLETLQTLTEGEQEHRVKDTVEGDEHRILGFGKSTLNIYPRSNKYLTNTHLLRGLRPPLLQQLTLPTITTTTNTTAVPNTTTSQTPGTPQA